MKVGILTFHSAYNYGAMLQAYALQETIKKTNCDINIIDYQPKYIESFYKPFNFLLEKQINRSIIFKVKMLIFRLYNFPYYLCKRSNFRRFMNTKMLLTKKKYRDNELINLHEYEAIICGSDQIWNPIITNGFDRTFFCDFNGLKSVVKISYAASIGIKDISENNKLEFAKLVNNFDFISIREKTALEFVRSCTQIPVIEVLDPTLLLSKNEWASFAIKPNIKTKYVLIYRLWEGKTLSDISHKVADILNIKIVEICYDKSLRPVKRKQITTGGPQEFLGLFLNADFIVTDSFHGSVFSIIFNKPFYVVPHRTSGSRMIDLLKKLGLTERIAESVDAVDICNKTDYRKASEILEKEIDISLTFLKSAIFGGIKK